MTATALAAPDRLPFKTKLAFGVGASAEYICIRAISLWALLFYNQVLGVPAEWVGVALFVSLALDGITEPVVGSWSDRTRSRWGRRHPWMWAGILPITFSFWAIWNPPRGFDDMGLAIWCGVWASMLRQVMTFFHTPHLALGGEMSANYTERTRVMAYNSFLGWAGAASLSTLGLTYFFPRTPEYRNGLLNPDAWPAFSNAFTLAVFAFLLISCWFTMDRIPHLSKPPRETPPFSAMEFLRDMLKALSNWNYIWLLLGYLFLSLMLGLRENLHVYVNSYFWQLETAQMRWLVLGSFAGYLTGFFFSSRLHGRFDKKRTIIFAVLVYSLVPPIPIMMGMAGLLTPETPNLLAILIAFYAVQTGAISILAISVMSALADIADQNELKHGIRQEGILYSTRTLSAKIDQALGALIAGYVLAFIGMSEKVRPKEIAPEVMQNLALWDGPLAAIPGIVAAFFYARYGINRDAYAATKAALAERRAARAEMEAQTPPPAAPGAAPAPAE